MKKKLTIAAGALAAIVLAAAVAVALVFLFVETASERKEEAHRAGYPHAAANAPRGDERQADGNAEGRGQADEETDEESGDGESEMVGVEAEEKSEEELQEEEEEKKVDAFDSLTDKWMEKEGGEVTMKDMDAFVAAFKSVPDKRKDECLHRALNLVSDDHVLLLAGILFDKTVEKEYLELVFNDILNRDEDVKKLILPKIYKDKTHPCWADTAWILDVTGETPNKDTKQGEQQ